MNHTLIGEYHLSFSWEKTWVVYAEYIQSKQEDISFMIAGDIINIGIC